MIWWLWFLSHWLFTYWNWHLIESLFTAFGASQKKMNFTAFGWKEIREDHWKGKGTVFIYFLVEGKVQTKRKEKRDKGKRLFRPN